VTYRDEAEALRVEAASRERRQARIRQLDGVGVKGILGAYREVRLEVDVQGELPVDQHGRVARRFEAVTGLAAQPSTVARTLFLAARRPRELSIRISPLNGRTTILLEEYFGRTWDTVTLVLGTQGVLVVTMLFTSARPWAVAAIGVTGLCVLVTHVLRVMSGRRRAAAAVNLLIDLEAAVKDSVREPSRDQHAPRVRVAASDEGDEPESSAEEARRARAQAAAPRK
jgi:hypothetical protein